MWLGQTIAASPDRSTLSVSHKFKIHNGKKGEFGVRFEVHPVLLARMRRPRGLVPPRRSSRGDRKPGISNPAHREQPAGPGWTVRTSGCVSVKISMNIGLGIAAATILLGAGPAFPVDQLARASEIARFHGDRKERASWFRFRQWGGDAASAARTSVSSMIVIHVAGTFCCPCVRAVQRKGWCRLGDSNPRPHHYE